MKWIILNDMVRKESGSRGAHGRPRKTEKPAPSPLPTFADVLSEKIKQRRLSDREVAVRAGLSPALLSALKRSTKPSFKVCVSLAWALNANPATLYDETCELLDAADHTDVLRSSLGPNPLFVPLEKDDTLWLYAPDSIDLADLSKRDFGSKLTVFTQIDHARQFWRSQQERSHGRDPWYMLEPPFLIKTPPEHLLTHNSTLLIKNPDNESYVEVYKWLGTIQGRPMLRLPQTPPYVRLIRALAVESRRMNVYELARFESRKGYEAQKHSQNLVIIVYTQTYPELEGTLIEHRALFDTVLQNLARGVRYLYLHTATDKSTAKHVFNSLRRRLRDAHASLDDRNFRMEEIGVPELLREQTITAYALLPLPQQSHEDVGKYVAQETDIDTLITQVEGSPARFEEATPASLSLKRHTLLEPILSKLSDIARWLMQDKPTDPGAKEKE